MEALINRITINQEICHGKPTIRNMRYPVELILDLLSSGMTTSEIIGDYPALVEDTNDYFMGQFLYQCLFVVTNIIALPTKPYFPFRILVSFTQRPQ